MNPITDEDVPGLSQRHEATQRHARYLNSDHLPEDLQRVALAYAYLACTLLNMLPDGPELTNGLHDLVRSKDCLVRHALDSRKELDNG